MVRELALRDLINRIMRQAHCLERVARPLAPLAKADFSDNHLKEIGHMHKPVRVKCEPHFILHKYEGAAAPSVQ